MKLREENSLLRIQGPDALEGTKDERLTHEITNFYEKIRDLEVKLEEEKRKPRDAGASNTQIRKLNTEITTLREENKALKSKIQQQQKQLEEKDMIIRGDKLRDIEMGYDEVDGKVNQETLNNLMAANERLM